MHKVTVFPTGLKAIFLALFISNYWLREFLLPAVVNHFELRFQSKATDTVVLQNLSLLACSPGGGGGLLLYFT